MRQGDSIYYLLLKADVLLDNSHVVRRQDSNTQVVCKHNRNTHVVCRQDYTCGM